MVSTSKWMAILVAPVVASQSSSGPLVVLRASGGHRQAPLVGDVRQGWVRPVVHADESNAIGGSRGRQEFEDFAVAMPRER
jgi:hypothetical protein